MIETVYSLTLGEFAEAQKLWCPSAVRKLPGHWLYQIVLIAFATLVILSIPHLPFGLGISFALCMGAFSALGFWRKKYVIRRQFEQMGDSVLGVSLRLDDEGYHDSKDGSGSCWIAWKRFTGWKEGSSVFVMGLGLQFLCIPKAALTGDQQQEFRNTLRTKIG